MKNVFVGNMSFEATESGLRSIFEPFGEITRIQLITDRDTGRARGFGFVEMVEVEDAINAAVYFSGTELEGRKIHVDPFRAPEPGAQKYRGERKRRAPAKRSTGTSNGTA